MTGNTATTNDSEAVNLDETNGANANFRQELVHGLTLVSLQLDDLPILSVLHHCAVAIEQLFANSGHFLQIILWVDSLNCGQGFPSISLLNTDMDQSTLDPSATASMVFSGISKRIISFQISCKFFGCHRS